MHRLLLATSFALTAFGIVQQPAAAQTLKAVKERGALNCGVSQGLIGFSFSDDRGNWSGFDVDLCRALAAAIFNDVTKVKYVALDPSSRFSALKSGIIDVLSRNTTWTISREMALGPVVRQGDDQWLNIVKWTHFALLNAEELGVGTKTIDEATKSEKPDVRRLVGNEGDYGQQLGLTKDWVVRIVRLVGNYGEIFERNVGAQSRLAVPRGINNLWTNGGIQYAPPIQ